MYKERLTVFPVYEKLFLKVPQIEVENSTYRKINIKMMI